MKRRRRRRNPAIQWGKLGLGLLGATAAAAAAYALEGTNLGRAAVGGIQLAGSLAVGIPVAMVNEGIGTGIAMGGAGIGLKSLGGELADMAAKPASANGNGDTAAVRARLGALRRRSVTTRALPAAAGRGVNVSQAEQALNAFSAIRARI